MGHRKKNKCCIYIFQLSDIHKEMHHRYRKRVDKSMSDTFLVRKNMVGGMYDERIGCGLVRSCDTIV